jgi:hypothetical protein
MIMKKWFPILIVFCAILILDCIAMRYRISVQECIIKSQKEAIQREHETHRLYERRCDSLIARYDSLFNELMR